MTRALISLLIISVALTTCDQSVHGVSQDSAVVSNASVVIPSDSASLVRAAIEAVDPTGRDSLEVARYLKDSLGVSISLVRPPRPGFLRFGGGGEVHIDRAGAVRVVALYQ